MMNEQNEIKLNFTFFRCYVILFNYSIFFQVFMGCLECKVFFCENSGAWKFEVTRKARLDHVHGYWNRVRQSYNSTILVKLASVRCLRHNSRYSTQRIGHRSQSCLEGQIDSSDVRHVQIFPVPYRPYISAQASLRYLIDYLGCKTHNWIVRVERIELLSFVLCLSLFGLIHIETFQSLFGTCTLHKCRVSCLLGYF